MVGNAVPVNLGYYVADAIFRYSGEQRKINDEFKKSKPVSVSLFD